MSDSARDPISPELRRYVDAARDNVSTPSSEMRRRLLERLDASASMPPIAPRPAPVAGKPPRSFGKSLVLVASGALLGAGAHAMFTAARIQQPMIVAAPVASPKEAPVLAPPVVVPQQTASLPPRREAPIRDQNLTAERELLEVARTALLRGAVEETIDALRRHLRKFPSGRLAEERESLWVIALVRAELYPEARQRGARFHHMFPNSLLTPAVDESLKNIP